MTQGSELLPSVDNRNDSYACRGEDWTVAAEGGDVALGVGLGVILGGMVVVACGVATRRVAVCLAVGRGE